METKMKSFDPDSNEISDTDKMAKVIIMSSSMLMEDLTGMKFRIAPIIAKKKDQSCLVAGCIAILDDSEIDEMYDDQTKADKAKEKIRESVVFVANHFSNS